MTILLLFSYFSLLFGPPFPTYLGFKSRKKTNKKAVKYMKSHARTYTWYMRVWVCHRLTHTDTHWRIWPCKKRCDSERHQCHLSSWALLPTPCAPPKSSCLCCAPAVRSTSCSCSAPVCLHHAGLACSICLIFFSVFCCEQVCVCASVSVWITLPVSTCV